MDAEALKATLAHLNRTMPEMGHQVQDAIDAGNHALDEGHQLIQTGNQLIDAAEKELQDAEHAVQEFTQFVNPFAARGNLGGREDFYTTVAREIGKAVGISTNAGHTNFGFLRLSRHRGFDPTIPGPRRPP